MAVAVYIAIILHFLRKISRKITYRPGSAPLPKCSAYLVVRDLWNPEQGEAVVAAICSEHGPYIHYAFMLEHYLPQGFDANPMSEEFANICGLPPRISSKDSPFDTGEITEIMAAVTQAAHEHPEIIPICRL